MSRKVTVYNTLGGNMTPVETSATTWSELQRDLDRYGVSYSGMSAVIGATQVSLESPAAQLPTEPFQLFLAAKKVKSGAISGYDESIIDWSQGMKWDGEDWDEPTNTPEDYEFATTRDLAIARAMKARFYLNKVITYLTTSSEGPKLQPTSPEVAALQKTAEEIKKNLGLYD